MTTPITKKVNKSSSRTVVKEATRTQKGKHLGVEKSRNSNSKSKPNGNIRTTDLHGHSLKETKVELNVPDAFSTSHATPMSFIYRSSHVLVKRAITT